MRIPSQAACAILWILLAGLAGAAAAPFGRDQVIPQYVAVCVEDAQLTIDLRGRGDLQLTASIAIPDYDMRLPVCLCEIASRWEIFGTYPFGTRYQLRTNAPQAAANWRSFALQVDLRSTAWGTPGQAKAWILPASQFSQEACDGDLCPIVPNPRIELGPSELIGHTPGPFLLTLRFPAVCLEWSRDTGRARVRAGNVVLKDSLDWWWDDVFPQILHVGPFSLDLGEGRVAYRTNGASYSTRLAVSISESEIGGGALELQLWD
jgi:hypothetical protein